jgi:hypothetical protein
VLSLCFQAVGGVEAGHAPSNSIEFSAANLR